MSEQLQIQDKNGILAIPVLSIVIVDSDSRDLTLDCLASIHRHHPKDPFEIILVDNCSESPCLVEAKQLYPRICTFSAPCRQGFAKNYNLGIRKAVGDYILILNNDTVIHPGALDFLLTAIHQDSSFRMVGPRLVDSLGRIQSVCARSLLTPCSYILSQLLLDKTLPVGRIWERWQSWRINRRLSGLVPCISGACMLVSRQLLETIGLFDEGYEFYFEDVEWCHRLKKNGYKVGYVAEALITHLGDQSLSKNREWAKKSEYLSALRYFKQYYSLTYLQANLFWAIMILNFSLRWLAFWLIRFATGKTGQLSAYRHLIPWIIQNPPSRTYYNHPA